MNTSDARPFGSDSSTELGPDPERVEFEAWLNPGNHPGNVSRWVPPGRYEKDTHNLAWLAWKAAMAAERERWAETAKERMQAMTDEQRIALIDGLMEPYCKACGSKFMPCYCWRDE